ncbi:MAG: TlpA disulfide reductase family protein [Acidobacteria bacterium]|nr:TlpA disulfide reductase family protein [Acidobacteriota bacterium]
MTFRIPCSLAASAALLAVLAGCSHTPPRRGGKAAPDFSLRDVHGKTVKLSDYRGKVVVLNFWATWCGPCKVEIPWFMEFEQRYKDRGFAVLGVAMDDEGWTVVKPYIEAERVNYRVVVGNDEVSTKYGGVDSLPTTMIVDRQGQIAATHIGLVSKGTYEDDIARLLN